MTTAPSVSGHVAAAPDLDAIRSHFPSLNGKTILLENAGGSQVPRAVADGIRHYMLENYVQLGAGYDVSNRCTAVVNDAHEFINLFMNGVNRGKVILGASCTQLLYMLADCYFDRFEPGDELVIAEIGHEANIGPWVRMAARKPGVVVKWWKIDPETFACPLDELEALLSDRTKLVIFPHVSNLLGEIVDAQAVADLAHAAGARVVVDGVALAPHRAIDVEGWAADWYVYSTYKVYGPHMGALFGTNEAIAELTGPNHFFIPKETVPYKFELGGASHEGCAGLLALGDYLRVLSGKPSSGEVTRGTIERAFEVMTRCELPLQARLVEYLASRSDVRIIGPAHGERSRIGTISFRHRFIPSREIVKGVQARGIGIRYGHMYAYRLCKALGIDLEDGVVRISFVHYNTMDEVERCIEALDGVLNTG